MSTAAVAAPARDRLRTVDPIQARLVTEAIAALRLTPVGTAALLAKIATDPTIGGAWILCDTPHGSVALAPIVADGSRATTTVGPGEPDAVAAMNALGRIEPLVAAIETALALDLHPTDLSTALPAPPILDLSVVDRIGAVSQRVLLALPPTMPPPARPAGTSQRLPPGMRLPWRATVAGPIVRRDALAKVSRGALVLLGQGPLIGRVEVAGRLLDDAGIFEPNDRRLRLEAVKQGATMDEMTIEPAGGSAEPDEGATPLAGLRLRLDVLIAGGEIEAGALTTLGGGAVLPLPGTGATLPVRLLTGGTHLAEGELVAVGEGYGVLVTRLLTDAGREG